MDLELYVNGLGNLDQFLGQIQPQPQRVPEVYWLYSSRKRDGTWWFYSKKHTMQLEDALSQGSTGVPVVLDIDGTPYHVDLQSMTQTNMSNTQCRRLVKRVRANELDSIVVKGINGKKV